MGSNPAKLIGLALLLPALLLFGLVEVAGAAGCNDACGRPAVVEVAAYMQVITLPTPFPTPAAVTYTAELKEAFWDVTNYEGAVSGIQTLFLLSGIQNIIVIFAWLGVMAIGFALVRGIIAGATSKPASNADETGV